MKCVADRDAEIAERIRDTERVTHDKVEIEQICPAPPDSTSDPAVPVSLSRPSHSLRPSSDPLTRTSALPMPRSGVFPSGRSNRLTLAGARPSLGRTD
jgi:hypothetical protein